MEGKCQEYSLSLYIVPLKSDKAEYKLFLKNTWLLIVN